jgi:predicted metalloprotease with PDZ domain
LTTSLQDRPISCQNGRNDFHAIPDCHRRLAVCVTAQELPRRGAIGLVITVKNGSVVVQQVVTGGAGEAAGFRAEDWIRGVDGETITRPEQFTQAIGRRGGWLTVRQWRSRALAPASHWRQS